MGPLMSMKRVKSVMLQGWAPFGVPRSDRPTLGSVIGTSAGLVGKLRFKLEYQGWVHQRRHGNNEYHSVIER
jgi:hypothetical protein